MELIGDFIRVLSEGEEEGSEYRLGEESSNSNSSEEVILTTLRHRKY